MVKVTAVAVINIDITLMLKCFNDAVFAATSVATVAVVNFVAVVSIMKLQFAVIIMVQLQL